MTMLITGAGGFLGSSLISHALGQGEAHAASLIAVARNPAKVHLLAPQGRSIRTVPLDLLDPDAVSRLLEREAPTICVHLAWHTDPQTYLDSSLNASWVKASLHLGEVLSRVGCRRMVVAGTCGELRALDRIATEKDATQPQTRYAEAKLELRKQLELLSKKSSLSFAWARIFNVYGPRENAERLMPSCIAALKKGIRFPTSRGEQKRDYLYVDDVAAALWCLAQSAESGVFNVSSGTPVRVRDVLTTLGEMLGRADLLGFGERPERAWDPPMLCGDSSRLQSLGWKPQVSLSEGLRRTIDAWAAKPQVY